MSATGPPVFEGTSGDRGLCGLPMNVLQDYLIEGLTDDFASEDMYEAAELVADEEQLPAGVFAAVVKSEGIDVGAVPGSMIKKVYELPRSASIGHLPSAVQCPPIHRSASAATLVEDPKKRKVEVSRPKTQAQIDRRRDRNRILARRTRLRKKYFFESLQQQVAELERENAMLKEIMRTHPALASEAQQLCGTSPVVTDSRSNATELLTPTDFALMRLLSSAQRSFCITDPSLEDNPIVYASQAFLAQTGYALDQVVGRNCRFLQGPLTDRATVEKLRNSISRGQDVSVTLLNYKADGTTFWNQLFIASLRDINERVVNFVGVQTPVPGPTPPADGSGGGIQHPAESSKLHVGPPPSKVIVPASPLAHRIGSPELPTKDHPAASLLASPVFAPRPAPDAAKDAPSSPSSSS